MNRMSELYDIFLTALASANPFPQVIDALCAKLHWDICVCDSFGRSLLSSNRGKILVDYTLLDAVQSQPDRPSVLFPTADPSRNYYIQVLDEHNPMRGYVVIRCKGKADPAVVKYTAEHLAKLYLQNDHSSDSSTSLVHGNKDLIARELLCHFDDGATFRWQYDVEPAYMAALAFHPNPSVSREAVKRAHKTVAQYFPDSFHIEEDGQLLLFFYSVRTNESPLTEQLAQIMKRYGLRCSVSSRFSAIQDRAKYIAQVRSLAKLSRYLPQEQDLYLASELYAPFLALCAVERAGAENLLSGEIQQLEDYDRLNKTEYLSTLEVYLNSGNHASQTAAELFIDRSTLNYRINKIKALLYCDVDDYDTSCRLKLELFVYKIFKACCGPAPADSGTPSP